MDLAATRTKLLRLAARRDVAAERASALAAGIAGLDADVAACEAAQRLAQEVAAEVQHTAHGRVASVVTHCLKAVFEDAAYEFRLVWEQKRGRTECRPTFVRGGMEVHPTRGAGGGAVDVASLALRLAALAMARPRRRMLLVMDEPLKWLSSEYVPAACSLLEQLADWGVQFILVTHDEALRPERAKVVEIGP